MAASFTDKVTVNARGTIPWRGQASAGWLPIVFAERSSGQARL
jgi:hypothetical protein